MNIYKIIAWSLGASALLLLFSAIALLHSFGLVLAPLDSEPPVLPGSLARPAILVFSKANGVVHSDAIPAVENLFKEMAQRNGWGIVVTDNGAVMNPEQLARFDVVIGNNNSGTNLDEAQQAAFRHWLQNGGGFVGIHGAGGDFMYRWDWYGEELIGAQYSGHPTEPLFQDAVVMVNDRSEWLTEHLPARWTVRQEEWYTFANSPRRLAYTILLSLDESSYDPGAAAMAGEHPVAWSHDIGEGLVVYSAIGHNAATYSLPGYIEFLERAVRWTGRFDAAAGGSAQLP